MERIVKKFHESKSGEALYQLAQKHGMSLRWEPRLLSVGGSYMEILQDNLKTKYTLSLDGYEEQFNEMKQRLKLPQPHS